jgi:hypothetical protein
MGGFLDRFGAEQTNFAVHTLTADELPGLVGNTTQQSLNRASTFLNIA